MKWWYSIGQSNENVHGIDNMSIISIGSTFTDTTKMKEKDGNDDNEKNKNQRTLHLIKD
jgi:hypothetical protein